VSVINPTFLSELQGYGSQGTKTIEFLGKVLNAIKWVDLSVAGAVVSGQVKNGDGTNHSSSISVLLNAHCQNPPTMTVGTGSARAGNGTNSVWIATNASGQFTVTVAAAGSNILVAATPENGITTTTEADEYV